MSSEDSSISNVPAHPQNGSHVKHVRMLFRRTIEYPLVCSSTNWCSKTVYKKMNVSSALKVLVLDTAVRFSCTNWLGPLATVSPLSTILISIFILTASMPSPIFPVEKAHNKVFVNAFPNSDYISIIFGCLTRCSKAKTKTMKFNPR